MDHFICRYPFQAVSKTSDGVCGPCCRYEFSETEFDDPQLYGSIEEAFNSKSFKAMRQAFLDKKKLASCQKCYQEEEAGYISMGRDFSNKCPVVSDKITFVELAFSNECNFKCRMCGPHSSNLWAKEWNQLFPDDRFNQPPPVELSEVIRDDETFSNVKFWKIVGGEPFLTKGFEQFLEKLGDVDLSEVTIQISTNSSVFPRERIINLLKRFKSVQVDLSIDGVGAMGEYIRTNSNWKIVDRVAQKWVDLSREHNQLVLRTYMTISAYNAHEIYKVFSWSSEKGIPFRFQILRSPEYLRLSVLPLSVRKKIFQYYEKFSDFSENAEYLRYHFLETAQGDLEEFLSFTSKLDHLRGDDFFKVNQFYIKEELM